MPRDSEFIKQLREKGILGNVTEVNIESLPRREFEKDRQILNQIIYDSTQLINFELVMHEPDIVPERYLQDAVATVARAHGWMVAHFRPAIERGQYATPVAYDAEGFPDLVLVRDRVIYAELKSEKGELTFEEAKWIRRLEDAKEEVYVWRPSMWKEIKTIITREPNGKDQGNSNS